MQGLVDTLQIFALLLSTFCEYLTSIIQFTILTRASLALGETRRSCPDVLSKDCVSYTCQPLRQHRCANVTHRPNVLAFNFASGLVQSLILLVTFMAVAGVLLYFFMKMTAACCSVIIPEGLQSTNYMKHTWAILLTSFTLSVIYLPLSTMAVHVLIWSDDLWAIPNPYTNATTFPPQVEPLGPSDEFRDPLDFCYTTTMRRNEINYAPAVFIIAVLCFLGVRCLPCFVTFYTDIDM